MGSVRMNYRGIKQYDYNIQLHWLYVHTISYEDYESMYFISFYHGHKITMNIVSHNIAKMSQLEYILFCGDEYREYTTTSLKDMLVYINKKNQAERAKGITNKR